MNVFNQYISEIIVDAWNNVNAFIIGGVNGNAYGRDDYSTSGDFDYSLAQGKNFDVTIIDFL